MNRIDMDTVNRNGLWCSVIADAVADAGVREVVVSPGGRASALAMSLNAQPDLRTIGHIDERSGAFMALGMALTTGRPAAICTTSGSAVANLLPALTEAYARGLPLILLTCDRPRTTRGKTPPQSTQHIAICAPLVQTQLDLNDPEDTPAALAELRRRILASVMASTQIATAGPVHINIPQPGWLCATETEAGWQAPISAAAIRQRPPTPAQAAPANAVSAETIGETLGARPGLRGLIVAGPDSPLTTAQLEALATTSGYPLLADAPSQYRRPAVSHVIASGDALALHPELEAGRVELLIRIGAPPVASTLQQYLARVDCPVLRISQRDSASDFIGTHHACLVRPDTETLLHLASCLGPGCAIWRRQWANADAFAQNQRSQTLAQLPWGEICAADRIVNTPGFGLLHLANSMSVRHGNLLSLPGSAPQRIVAYRGVNGIDGTLGAFIGELAAGDERGLLLLGDQAMVHDLAALANPICRRLRGLVCVMNNGGGGIFDLIACSRLEGYRETMRNPPAVDFEHLARAFNLPFRRCDSRETLELGLEWGQEGVGLKMLEITVPASGMEEQVRKLYRAMITG